MCTQSRGVAMPTMTGLWMASMTNVWTVLRYAYLTHQYPREGLSKWASGYYLAMPLTTATLRTCLLRFNAR